MVTLYSIVACAKNRVIGGQNKMLWHIPEDFAFFKKTTMGYPIIMGRKTWRSIGRALPGRLNVVITRSTDYEAKGARCFTSLAQALERIEKEYKRAFIIGGGQLYQETLPMVSVAYVTEIDRRFQGDTYYPRLDANVWQGRLLECLPPNEKRDFRVRFMRYRRKA